MQKKRLIWLALFFTLALLLAVWTRSGFTSLRINTDIGRDLKEISNIQAGTVVWLGPWLGPGLHASSVYYYLFYPAIFLAQGKIVGLIGFNVLIGLCSVALFGFMAAKKYGYKGIISTFFLGLLPMVTDNILHPGNGYTYLFFICMSLTALWFELPLVVGSFAAGMAMALHPAAGVLPLFLLYEWWQRGRSWKSAALSLAAFLFPLGPLIAFEVITRGFITRSFLNRPASGHFAMGFTWANWEVIAQLLGMSLLVFVVLFALAGFLTWRSHSAKQKAWVLLSVVCLIIPVFFSHLVDRYLFGVALVVFFVMTVSLVRYSWTAAILGLLAVSLFFKSPLFYPEPVDKRNAYYMESVADFIADESLSNTSQKVALVAALSQKAEVPQADDYRFLLRNRGIAVVEVTAQAEADVLVMIIEAPDFEWEKWSNWEIESFGAKKVQSVKTFDGVTVVVFSKN